MVDESFPRLRVYPSISVGIVAWIIAKWIRMRREWYHAIVRVDRKAVCPSCGDRRRKALRYSPDYRALLLTCNRCAATFGRPTLVPVERWLVKTDAS